MASGDDGIADEAGRVLRTLNSADRSPGPDPGRALGLVNELTRRELEVLALLAAGRRNREIAAELVVSLDTAKKHISHILAKLGVTNRTEAVAHARVLRLVP